ncbi:MAG: hypothetical protein AB7K68_13765 [Bacteriovoracia bacterium]
MRFFLLLCLIPFTSLAAGGEPVFLEPGIYRFNQRFDLLQKKRYEIVYSYSDEGLARMGELRKQGYICNGATRDTFLCSAFQSLDGENPGLNERLQNQLGEVTLAFGPVRGPAEFVRKSQSNVEWNMPQSVDFRGKHFDSFRFLLDPTSGAQRIWLGEPSEESFVLSEAGAISYSLVISATESRNVYRRYLGLAGFSK